MRRLTALIAALALLAVACGSDESTTATLPDEGDTIILQTAYEGGFAPVEFILNQMPQHTLYADGRLVSQGPQPAIFPGPMLPSMQQVNIGDGAMAEVLAIVDEIGLPATTDETNSEAAAVVADASARPVPPVFSALSSRTGVPPTPGRIPPPWTRPVPDPCREDRRR